MAAPGYAPLEEIDENSSESLPLVNRNSFANNAATRHPSRAQTFPNVRGASYPVSEPLRLRPAAASSQTTSYDDLKSEAAGGRRRSSVQSWKQRLRGFVNPSLHDLKNSRLITSDTNRPYIYKRQKRRLWRLTIGEFLMTVVLCVANFGLLYGWSRHRTINERQKHIFNALSTGLTMLLGLNLAASLRSYAKLLRWRMLAAAYRPLGTFDLVLGCDSQINVLRLLWRARNSRYRYLPSRTQIFCLVWLGVNLIMAGIVASIGLTYNLDTSDKWVLTSPGNISVMDISNLQSQNYLFDLSYVQTWGAAGVWVRKRTEFEYANAAEGLYSSNSSGNARYWSVCWSL
jgi:hypothetical protein